MKIRSARLGDENRLAIIAKDNLGEGFNESDFKTTFNNPSMTALVAESAAGIVAYCVASFAADEAELLQIAVANSARRKGIARSMYSGLIEILKGYGAKKLFLEVRESNLVAIGFYESFHMKKVGMRPGFYENPKENALIYRLDM